MKLSTGLMIIGIMMISAAAGLAGWNMWSQQNADAVSEEILDQMVFDTPLRSEDVGEVVVPDYILNPDMNMPEEDVDGLACIGKLEIPALNICLPVAGEWSYKSLRKVPCRYTGSAYKDNMVIAAHNYKRHFGGLKTLSEGTDVIFTDIDGNVFEYSVAEIEMLAPERIEEMTIGEYPLTLFTCTAGGAMRVTVRCDFKE